MNNNVSLVEQLMTGLAAVIRRWTQNVILTQKPCNVGILLWFYQNIYHNEEDKVWTTPHGIHSSQDLTLTHNLTTLPNRQSEWVTVVKPASPPGMYAVCNVYAECSQQCLSHRQHPTVTLDTLDYQQIFTALTDTAGDNALCTCHMILMLRADSQRVFILRSRHTHTDPTAVTIMGVGRRSHGAQGGGMTPHFLWFVKSTVISWWNSTAETLPEHSSIMTHVNELNKL